MPATATTAAPAATAPAPIPRHYLSPAARAALRQAATAMHHRLAVLRTLRSVVEAGAARRQAQPLQPLQQQPAGSAR